MKTPLAWMLGIAALVAAVRVHAGDDKTPDPRIAALQRRMAARASGTTWRGAPGRWSRCGRDSRAIGRWPRSLHGSRSR